MATLTYGPILSWPTATGFRCLAVPDTAGTYTLETRITGTTDWTVSDTAATTPFVQMTNFGGDFRLQLAATGLTANTKYDYRILDTDGVTVLATHWCRTMPPDGGGRFILYFLADTHDAADTAAAHDACRVHYEATYDPIDIPALAIQVGDSTALSGRNVVPDISMWEDGGTTLPMITVYDDWDFGGNNSGADYTPAWGGTLAELLVAQAEGMRGLYDHPVADTNATSIDIASVPFTFADLRAARILNYNGVDENPDWAGDEPVPPFRCLGTAQMEWLIARMKATQSAPLNILVWTQTFKSPDDDAVALQRIRPQSANGAREWPSLHYSTEQEYFVENALAHNQYHIRRNLVVLSGDDHFTRAWQYQAGRGKARYAYSPGPMPLNIPIDGTFVREFKTSTGLSGKFLGLDVSGPGNLFEGGTFPFRANHVMTFDITASPTNTTARIRYRDWSDMDADTLDENGEVGDWYFDNGRMVRWATDVDTQQYPPSNSPTSGITFERTYIDDTLGMGHREGDIVRDQWGDIRRADDVDTEGRDETLHQHTPRAEREDVLE